MKEPFFKAKTGDPILSVHWNDMQVKVREEIAELIRTHQHTGGDQGTKVGGNGIDLQTTLMANKGLTVSYGNSPKQSLTVDGSTGDITTSSVVDVKAGLRIEGIKITKFATTLSASNAPADAIPTAAAVQSYVSTAVSAGNSSANGSLTVNTLTVGDKGTKLNTDGTATIGGSLTVGSTKLNTDGTAAIGGSLTVGSTKLNKDGTASIAGELTVGSTKLNTDGTATIGGSLTVGSTTLNKDGTASIGGSLTVGSTKLNKDGTATIAGDLTVGASGTKLNKDGTATIAGELTVDKLHAEGTAWIDGKLTANGGLDVAGALSVGSLTITGTLSVDTLSFGQEKIRIVRGRVTASGSVGGGVGFSVAKYEPPYQYPGVYIVTFVPSFQGLPTVVVTVEPDLRAREDSRVVSAASNAIVLDVRESSCLIKVGNEQGVGASCDFHFIAVGR